MTDLEYLKFIDEAGARRHGCFSPGEQQDILGLEARDLIARDRSSMWVVTARGQGIIGAAQ